MTWNSMPNTKGEYVIIHKETCYIIYLFWARIYHDS